jgi:VIT1/CCC1 family predicted Fe2+/Mn2+ transporter
MSTTTTAEHHVEHHMQSPAILTDIVIGMSDGLTVPFALAAGLSGAVPQSEHHLIWIAGLAEIAAGSIAMGLGGYLAGRTEEDHYNSELRREYDEVDRVPDMERDEVRQFFSGLGLSKDLQEQAVDEMTKDKDRWVDFMMKYELGLDKPDPQRDGLSGLKISAIITLCCLFVFGYFKSKLTGVHPLGGAIRVMVIGALAAGCAFAVAKMIQQ